MNRLYTSRLNSVEHAGLSKPRKPIFLDHVDSYPATAKQTVSNDIIGLPQVPSGHENVVLNDVSPMRQ